MKSTQWPIHWRYEGDKEKAKEFHGEARALIGQLKNQTYGGANLGSNRMVKTYASGVVITAEILPGIDKATIFVPKGAEQLREEGEYFPYLWVGVRIKSGGKWIGDDPDNENNYTTDMKLLLHVWDVPPANPGEGWSLEDPNEVQMVSSARHVVVPDGQTADVFPMQSVYEPYGAAYVGQDPSLQRWVTRAERQSQGTIGINDEGINWWSIRNFTYAHEVHYTKNGLMMPISLDPYDPEYDHDNPDDDKIWEEVAWLDPYTSKYRREKTNPFKDARGVHGPYDVSGDVEFEVPGKFVPGEFIAMVSVELESECEGWERPLICEMEMRIGKPFGPKGTGRTIRRRAEFEIEANPRHALYYRNFIPYGWYHFGHTFDLNPVGPNGTPWAVGDGPGSRNTVWWQGALIGNMMAGTITETDDFSFGDTGNAYTISNEFLGGNRYTEEPFGSIDAAVEDCYIYDCIDYPHTPHIQVVVPYGEPSAYIRCVKFSTGSAFTYCHPWATYLVGRLAKVVCGHLEDDGTVGSARIQVSDPDYDNYNGELHHVVHIKSVYGEPTRLRMGDIVVIREPWLDNPSFSVQPVSELGDSVNVYRKAAADFDSKYDPPPNY